MTWTEFKQFMERNGVRDDDQIEYIDTCPSQYSYVRRSGDGWVSVAG